MNPVYQLAIFDLDGTLIDSIGDIAAALNHALAAHGLPTHDEAAVRLMMGDGMHTLVRRAAAEAPEPMQAAVLESYRARYLAHAVERTRLYPGVAETLAAAPSLKKAIATNKPGEQARAIVAALGLGDLFFAVLGADDVGATKPDARVVERLRAEAGVAREHTLYVGDSLVDAATARAAGVDLCLVGYGYADPAAVAATPARYHVTRFAELAPLLAPPHSRTK